MDDAEWKAEETQWHSPAAVLRAGDKVIAKVYLSPDGAKLRIVLPELGSMNQIAINVPGKVIDFTRPI